MEYTLKLDPKTRDIGFDEEDLLATVDGDDVAVQNVNVNLNTRKGEFLLEETHGTDYARLLGEGERDVMSDTAEEVIRDGVLQEPNVVLITDLQISLDRGRVLRSHVTGELASNSTFTLEASVDG